jgi:hypothetical protein
VGRFQRACGCNAPAARPSIRRCRSHAHGCGQAWRHRALAASEGQFDVLRILLDHPSADPAAMLVHAGADGDTALIVAAHNAARSSPGNSSFAPLLLLLRHVAAEPQPCADQQAHSSRVLQACHGDQKALFNVDQPDDSRDECVRLLLARGAGGEHRRRLARRPGDGTDGERAAHHQRGRRGPGKCTAAAEEAARRRDVDVDVDVRPPALLSCFVFYERCLQGCLE